MDVPYRSMVSVDFNVTFAFSSFAFYTCSLSHFCAFAFYNVSKNHYYYMYRVDSSAVIV